MLPLLPSRSLRLVAFIIWDLSRLRLYFSVSLFQFAPLDPRLVSRLEDWKLERNGNAVFFNFPLLMMYLQQKETLGWFNIKYIKLSLKALCKAMETYLQNKWSKTICVINLRKIFWFGQNIIGNGLLLHFLVLKFCNHEVLIFRTANVKSQTPFFT